MRDARVGGHGPLLTAPASAADIAPPQSSPVAAAAVLAAAEPAVSAPAPVPGLPSLPSGTATMTSPLAGPSGSAVPARPAGAALVAADPADGLAGGVENFFATLSNLLGGLPGGQFTDFLAGAALLARRQLVGESLAAPANSVVGTGLPVPIPPIAPDMVRDLSVAVTGAQALALSWKAPAKGSPTSYTVTVETTPTDPSQEPTVSAISTSSESATFSALDPLDQYVFSVAAVYESGPGAARTTSYAATDGFLELTSFLSHPTAMLTAGDGSMWISYRPNLTDYLIKHALGCLGNAWCSQVFKVIPGARWVAKEYSGLPDQVKEVIAKVAQQPPPPPQVRQYKLVDGQWRLQTAILTEGRPQALAEDIEGNIWVANETGGFQGFLSALFPDFGNNTGVVQRIALESGRMQVAETIDVAGAPMLGSLVAAPDGGIWVGLDNRWGGWRPWPTPTVADGGPAVQLRRPTNGSVQGIYRTAAGVWTADPNPFKLRHPPVGLTVGADGILWATDTLKSNSGIAAYFGVNFTDLAVRTTLTRINPVTGERTDTNIGRGGQGVIAIPGQDAVVVATHDGWLTYSQGGGEIKKVEYREGKLKTVGQIDLNAEWFGVPSSDFRLQPDAGRPDSFTIAPDGSIWTSGRGANGQLRSNLFIGALDYVLGPLGAILPKIIRYSWELRSLVCQYKDCTFTPLIKYPDFKGSPGFIAQVWTPDRGLAAGQPTKFAAVPYRQVSGSVSPVAAPVQRGFWVDAGGAPLLIPMTPGTPVGLDATAGSSPGQVTLNWTPTAADGGTPVMSYTATVYQGDTAQTFARQTATAAGSSATFGGLASGAGTTYFTVSPTNFVGASTDRLGNVRSAGLWLAADGTPLSIDHLGVGIASDGMPFTDGGFNTYGNAYSWSALGGSDALRWNGVTFDIATANQPNFTRSEAQKISALADGQTLASQQVKPLGSNSYYMLNLAGAGVNGAQTGQAISLNYSDGTSETWTQSFSDWVNPQHYTGEAVVSTQSYANTAAGGTANLTNHVYGYSHPIAQGKTLESITLPNNPNLRLLDVEVTAATTVQLGNALNTFGITTPPWQVGNSQGFDGRGNYYNGPNLNGNFSTTGQGSVPATVMMTWAGAVFPVGPVPTSSDQVGGSSGPRNVVHAAGQLISVPAPPDQPGPCRGAACRQYTVLDTITVGDGGVGVSPAGGQGLALSGDGTRLYVLSNAGESLAVIDTGTGEVVNSIAVESGSAEGVAVSKDGTRLYVTNLASGTVSVLDAATGAVTKTLSGLGAPWDVVVSPDGKHAYVSNVDGGTAAPVSVITTATNAITATVSDPADTAFGLAVDGAGRLYVAADKQVFATDGGAAPAVVNTFDLAAFAGGMTANTDGSRLYVATRDTGEVQVFSYPYTTGYTTSALGGFDGPVAVALSPDGGRLYVANRDGNSVSVVNIASNTIIATLDVGSEPVDVAVSPDGTRVYVANNSGTVSVIAYDPTQLAAGYAYLIGAGANGAQVNQRITMVFTDRTEATWTQTFSDWANPGSVNGEAIMSLGGRVNQLGNQTDVPAYVYGYAIPVPADKTLASLILPDNPNLGILGVAVV